ncbi:MAG TPA: FKBP-type peptidyl-prolyl cis-trans isomerase [Actinomycetes bacterium]
MRRPAFLIVLALLAALLSACGSGSGSDGSLPEVKGDYGSKPKITVAKGSKPSTSLESEVLVEGDGKEVAKGDLLVADYLGATYRGTKTFDNSYDRGSPAAFTLKSGAGGVISGWVKALSGATVGSRVLLVAPPKDGYGKAGNPQAGIKGTDSLVFVVDLIAAYGTKAPLPKSSPATDLADGLPTVEGEADPTLTVPEGTDLPKAPVTTILSEGTGTEVAKGKLIVVQFTAVDWTGKVVSSTWKDGPRGVPVGAEGQPSPFDLLEGVPVGSRVLLQLPPPSRSDAAEENLAVVIDILGQHGPAKEKA